MQEMQWILKSYGQIQKADMVALKIVRREAPEGKAEMWWVACKLGSF